MCYSLIEKRLTDVVRPKLNRLAARCRAGRGFTQNCAGKKLVPQQFSCFAGLTDIAVPVVVNGRHVATMMGGQVFRRPPTERDFQMVVKMLKKATGMTLTEYVIRVRVEKAKTLLIDPTVRISEVVFAAGFGSIPRFNSVFKQCVGMPPTEFRATLQSSLPR
jgi:hypothetical protein